jgi:hypothetical protein
MPARSAGLSLLFTVYCLLYLVVFNWITNYHNLAGNWMVRPLFLIRERGNEDNWDNERKVQTAQCKLANANCEQVIDMLIHVLTRVQTTKYNMQMHIWLMNSIIRMKIMSTNEDVRRRDQEPRI